MTPAVNHSKGAALADIPEYASLAEVELPRLLLSLYAARFTGRLGMSRLRTRKTFRFQDGAPVGSESNLAKERLTAVLAEQGLLDDKNRVAVEAYAKQKRCPESVALLALRQLRPEELFQGLREQVRRQMLECFGWQTGDYALRHCEERLEPIQPLRIDPYRLVQEGLQSHWSLERLLGDLGPALQRRVRRNPRLGKLAKRLALEPDVARTIAGLDGNQTLATALGSLTSHSSSLAGVWVLDAAGTLETSDATTLTGGNVSRRGIEIQIQDPALSAPSGVAFAADDSKAHPSDSDPSPEASKMRAEVLDRLDQLDDLDFYELLGMPRNASTGDIRKAYFLAAKRYHPDAIARLGLQDLRNQTGEVFSKIAEANEVLSNKERRNAYDRSLESGLSGIDVTLIARAETYYRKGEILIHMGDFRAALEYMQNAVQLYPQEATYQSDLAWCYFKKSPPEREPALEHIRKAIALDPSNPAALFRQDLIEREN